MTLPHYKKRASFTIGRWLTLTPFSILPNVGMPGDWRTYLNSGLNAPVGMGLYALQLKPFLEQLPHNELLAITSEHLQSHTEETYNRVLDFLGLPRHLLESYPQANKKVRRKHKLSNATQQVLRSLNRSIRNLPICWERNGKAFGHHPRLD
jgi:hypothetical protein